MVQRHSSEGFCAFDDPLESAMFPALVELMKEREKGFGVPSLPGHHNYGIN
jgi:hypothetical protein